MQSGRLADRPFMLGQCLHTRPLTAPMWAQLGTGLHHSCLGYRIGPPRGGGGTRPGKGYQLQSDRCEAVAVKTQDG